MNIFFIIFLSFIAFGFIATVLHLSGYSIQILLYFLAFFQVCFLLYRFRARIEIDAFYLLYPLLFIILLFYIIKWILLYFLKSKVKKDKKFFISFFSSFFKISFEDSFLILHNFLKQNKNYERFMIMFFCNLVQRFTNYSPFMFFTLFLFLPSIFLNGILFFEVVLYNTVFYSLYVFVLNFIFNSFLRLAIFFSYYYYNEYLEKTVKYFSALLPEGEVFLQTSPITTSDFSSFGVGAEEVESLFRRYHEIKSFFIALLGLRNVLTKLKSFLFAIFTFNLFLCSIFSFFFLTEVYGMTFFFLLFVPFSFYFFVLVLSVFFSDVIAFLHRFYFLDQHKGKVSFWGGIVIFFFLFFIFILSEGISVNGFFLILLILMVIWRRNGDFILDSLLYIWSVLYTKGCAYIWYQKFACFLSYDFLNTFLTIRFRSDTLITVYYVIPFTFMLISVFSELFFYSRLHYGMIAIFLFFCFYFISFGFFFIVRGFNMEQVNAIVTILEHNCNFTPETLKNIRLKPEDFIGHVTVIEKVWDHYIDLRNYNKFFIFASNLLYPALCTYFVYFSRLFIFFLGFYLFSLSILEYNLVFLLACSCSVAFLYFPLINKWLYDSSFSMQYAEELQQFLEFAYEEYFWFNEQIFRAQTVFEPIIKAREEELHD